MFMCSVLNFHVQVPFGPWCILGHPSQGEIICVVVCVLCISISIASQGRRTAQPQLHNLNCTTSPAQPQFLKYPSFHCVTEWMHTTSQGVAVCPHIYCRIPCGSWCFIGYPNQGELVLWCRLIIFVLSSTLPSVTGWEDCASLGTSDLPHRHFQVPTGSWCFFGHPSQCELLSLLYNAWVSCCSHLHDAMHQNGSTALHDAAYFGSTDKAKYLVDHGASLDLQNRVSLFSCCNPCGGDLSRCSVYVCVCLYVSI